MRRRDHPVFAALTKLLGVMGVSVAILLGSATLTPAEAEQEISLSGSFLAGHIAQKRRDLPAAIKYLDKTLAQDADQPDVVRRSFLFNLMDGRVDTAMTLAERYTKSEAKAPIAQLALAVRDIKSEKWQAAIDRMSTLDSTGLNGFTVPMINGWATFALKGSKDGIEAMKALRDLGGTRALYDLHAGLMHDLSGDLAAAETYYLSVTEDATGASLRASRILGTLYERQGKPEKAKAIYGHYKDAQPDTQFVDLDLMRVDKNDKDQAPTLVTSASDGVAEALFGIASSLDQQGGGENALVLARLALYLRSDLSVMLYMAGGILEGLERYDDAIGIYKKIGKKTPFHRAAQIRIARNLDRMDKKDEAIKVLRAAAKARPKDPRPMIAIGDTYRRHEDWQAAIDAYDNAFKRIGTLEPRHWQLLYSRGIVLERAKDWNRAEADFLKALEFEPDQPLVLNYLGYSWVEQRKNLERALEMIKTAVAKRPHDGYITDSLGWVYYQFGRYEEAVTELERAVELRPADPVINDHLGDAYWRVGRHLEATFQWNHSLALDPEPELREKLEKKSKTG